MGLGGAPEMDRDSLRRSQQLDRHYFPPSTAQQADRPRTVLVEEPAELKAGQAIFLPPLTAQSQRGETRGGQKGSSGAPLRKLTTSGAQNGDRGGRRKANFNNTYSYGSNPSNPYEAIAEATPAILSTGGRDWQLLDLVLPYCCNESGLDDLGKDLAAFINENLKPNGSRTDTSPGRSHSPMRALWRAPNMVPAGSGVPGTAPSAAGWQQPGTAGFNASGMASPDLMGGINSMPPTPQLRQSTSPNRARTSLEQGPTAPILAWGDEPEVLNTGDSKFPKPSPLKSFSSTPAPGASTKIPTTAGAQQTSLNFERISTGAGGNKSSPAMAEPVSLVNMIGEKNSSRRQVQLMSTWLDAALNHVSGRAAAEGAHSALLAPSADAPIDTIQRLALANKFAESGYAAPVEVSALSQDARSSMARCVGACASRLVSHIAGGCFEDGALMARLWNMHTRIMDAEMISSHAHIHHLQSELKGMRDRVRRLDPLIDWDKESRSTIEDQRDRLESATNSLILARAERDALLRENDKIIAHYRKELKQFKVEQRRNAYRVARKLKIAHHTMALMQQDRDQLVQAVTYTKDQAVMLAKLVRTLHPKIKAVQKAMPDDDYEELEQIEVGLRNILATAEKVSDASSEAERMHYEAEEKVTAMAATDRENDDILEQILSGGDPDFRNGEPAQDEELAALDFGVVEDELLPDAASEEEEEEVAAAVSKKKESNEEELTKEVVNEADAALDEEAAELARIAEEKAAEAQKEAEAAAAIENERKVMEKMEAEKVAVAEKAKKKREKKKKAAEAEASAASVLSGSRPQSRSSVLMVSNETQTDLFRPATPMEEDSDTEPEPVKEPQPLHLLKAAEKLVLKTSGMKLTSPLKMDLKALEGGGSVHVDLFVDSIMATLNGCVTDIATKDGEIQAAKSKINQLSEDIVAKDQSGKQVRVELMNLSKRFAAMKSSIESIGLDPDKPTLPKPPPPEKVFIHVTDPAAAPPKTADSDGEKESTDRQMKDAATKKKTKSAGAAHIVSPKKDPKAAVAPSAPKEPKSSSPARERPVKADPPDPPKSKIKPDGPMKRRSSPLRQATRRDLNDSLKHAQSQKTTTPSEAPVLGKDRVVERREEKTGFQRMEEAVAKYSDARPRTLDWLIKLFDAIYRGKAISDEQRVKVNQEPLAMVDYMFQHLSGVYGTRDLVNQYCAQIVATMEQYRASDGRIVTFQRFITEEWDRKILSVYIDGLKRLSEPARVPCCDFPAEYTGNSTARRSIAPPVVDIRKCLSVADKVLMKRTSQASYSFAAALAVLGEPIGDTELSHFFVAPGYYGADIAMMRAYEQSRAEFRSIPVHVFLDMLCEEYLRCESVMLSALPNLFKKFDHDGDGFLVQSDIEPVFQNMAASDAQVEDTEAQADSFWVLLLAKETDGGDLSMMSPRDSGTEPIVGYRAFMEAAMKSDFIRSYIRLNKTPAAKLKLESSEEELSRILTSVMIRRHWSLHGTSLTGLFEDTGVSGAQIQAQVGHMLKETDGNRMAVALHALLKTIINRKLDLVVAKLAVDLGSSDCKVFEETLLRITNAAKVLYGADVIMVGDVIGLEERVRPVKTYAQQRAFLRWQAETIRIYNQLSSQMEPFIFFFLKNQPVVQKACAFWHRRGLISAVPSAAWGKDDVSERPSGSPPPPGP